MGSGHILVYAFDVLIQIYKKYGISERDAAQSILQNNLYGLDIDDRATQLAYFAVMMKARQYDRRIFSRGIQPHVYAIVESNGLDSNTIDYFTNNDPKLKKDFGTLVDELRDAKEYGSILNITPVDFAALYARVEEVREDISLYRENVVNIVLPLIQVAEVMAQKYDVVMTNPPYMGSSNMDARLSEFVKKHYPDSKSDLFAVFMQRADSLVKNNRYTSLITMESWMFLSSFEKLREIVNRTKTIINMVHMPYLGKGGTSLGINFGTAAVVMQKGYVPEYNAQYEYTVYYECDENGVPFEFPTKNERWKTAKQSNFSKIPGSPVAYWASAEVVKAFSRNKTIDECAFPRQGLATGNNDRFLRLWTEILFSDIMRNAKDHDEFFASKKKYVPYNKGGAYRKWYANLEWVIRFDKPNYNVLQTVGNHLPSKEFYFHESITWSKVTSGGLSMRYIPQGAVFDVAGCSIFANQNLNYILAFANTKVMQHLMNILSQTLNYEVGNVKSIPLILGSTFQQSIVESKTNQNLFNSKNDFDCYETSWDFQRHPLIRPMSRLADTYTAWKPECEQRFLQLKTNEEELNRIFIEIYGLQDELTPEVADKDVTVHRIFDTKEDVPESMHGSNYIRTKRDEIVSLISYAVGCMFGRYSLDVGGLAYAGGDWDASKYSTIIPDKDNIIPICDDDYFDDDITGRFVKWVETVYGSDTLEENLKFIADALGGKGTPREVIRSYFLNDFYADHCKTYQKRPIYWLFDSGKKNGFKALIYMHRYQSDLLARMRTDYVHEQQERYRTQLAHLADALEHAFGSERVKLTKQQKKLQDQSLEIQKYEEKIHHLADQNISIDLDDGVKHNYALFADVLAKIK